VRAGTALIPRAERERKFSMVSGLERRRGTACRGTRGPQLPSGAGRLVVAVTLLDARTDRARALIGTASGPIERTRKLHC